MTYTVTAGVGGIGTAAGVGGSRLGPSWPVAALAGAGAQALGAPRDGQLSAVRSRHVTSAAFAFVALTAAAAASQLLDRSPLSLPSLASLQTTLTTDLTSDLATVPASTTEARRAATPLAAAPSAAGVPAGTAVAVAAQLAPAANTAAVRPVPAAGGPSPAVMTALTSALAVRGKPYVWGGASTRGFDCSGLVQWAYRRAGIALPRTSQQQSLVGQPVPSNQLRPGDLVFFYSTVHHVGIYLGNGQVLNAPQTGDVVRITPMSRMPFHNARRVA